jgi:hypothetical protein
MTRLDYYNTNNEVGTALADSRDTARCQQERILKYFKWSFHDGFSPDEIWVLVFQRSIPLTSVRRAVTNLTLEGHLVKTEHTKVGCYGKRCHVWMLAERRIQQDLFAGIDGKLTERGR